jgi:hypothetical protein
LQSFELAFEMLGPLERLTVDDLHGAQRAHDVPRQPDFAIAALADAAEQLVTWM